MGWCQEFGVQIQDGCDHVMVAGADSCSCTDCGVVCRGKFSGCATVWAAGPVQVTLRRPTRDVGRQPALADPTPTNGKSAQDSPHQLPAHPSITPATGLSGDVVVALLQSLRSEIQTLNRKVERVQGRAEAAEQAAKAASQVATELPQRLGRAVSAALQQQHGAILDDLAGLRKQVAADVGQIGDKLRPPADLAIEASLMGQLDARFEWLVNELSERLVVLGNEVVRINQQLSARDNPRPLSNGQMRDTEGARAP